MTDVNIRIIAYFIISIFIKHYLSALLYSLYSLCKYYILSDIYNTFLQYLRKQRLISDRFLCYLHNIKLIINIVPYIARILEWQDGYLIYPGLWGMPGELFILPKRDATSHSAARMQHVCDNNCKQ